ncbi:hypothetical protein GCM10009839_10380 [Catenulispora yoronensis]|uniref:N-acetyltransferase domain-containing protein n=1 Tax=Catenulispora yoronensis TaxID=450799 RepID=A0ABN2TQ23_9ACTN
MAETSTGTGTTGRNQPLGDTELRLMQRLAQQITATDLELVNSDATYGELAWNWGRAHRAESGSWRHRLWFDGTDGTDRTDLIAWAWAALPREVPRADGTVRDYTDAYLTYQIHPDHNTLIDDVIGWYEQTAAGVRRTLVTQAADQVAQARWAAHGYTPESDSTDDSTSDSSADDGDWTQLNTRDLEDIETPDLPDGFAFTTAADAGPGATVRAHLAAWPASTMTDDAYQGLLQAPGYRPDLHLLIQAPDGTMAASAVMWLDPANATVEFEPVGTHPGFRRLGLGRALVLHGLHTARAAGASHATVACLGAPAHPKARGLYYSVGFRYFSRDVLLAKAAVQ